MMDYDIPAEQRRARPCALTPGIESPDGLAAASRGLGRRARDGAARATPSGSWTSSTTSAPAASSSPTSTPAGSEPRRGRRVPAAHLAAARRPARRLVLRRRCCWSSCVVAVVRRSTPRSRAAFTPFQRAHADRPRRCWRPRLVYALVRSRVVADPERPGRGQRLPPPRLRVGRRSSRSHLPPGAPWATLDLADGTTVSAMGIQGSDGDRAQARAPRAAGAADPVPRARAGPRLRLTALGSGSVKVSLGAGVQGAGCRGRPTSAMTGARLVRGHVLATVPAEEDNVMRLVEAGAPSV